MKQQVECVRWEFSNEVAKQREIEQGEESTGGFYHPPCVEGCPGPQATGDYEIDFRLGRIHVHLGKIVECPVPKTSLTETPVTIR